MNLRKKEYGIYRYITMLKYRIATLSSAWPKNLWYIRNLIFCFKLSNLFLCYSIWVKRNASVGFQNIHHIKKKICHFKDRIEIIHGQYSRDSWYFQFTKSYVHLLYTYSTRRVYSSLLIWHKPKFTRTIYTNLVFFISSIFNLKNALFLVRNGRFTNSV